MSSHRGSGRSSNSTSGGGTGGGERSLLVIILDVSPVVWGERDVQRSAMDKARMEKNKRSAGPGTLNEMLVAIQAFCSAFDNLQRDGVLVIIGVAGNEKPELLYPNEDDLQSLIDDGSKVDIRKLNEALIRGVSNLVGRAAATAERMAAQVSSAKEGESETNNNNNNKNNTINSGLIHSDGKAAMAAALSVALCVINRFLVAVHAGVSALTADTSVWNRQDDEGVLSILGGGGSSSSENNNSSSNTEKTNVWSPRIFMMQASEDRTCDYNAFMNCTFASSKHNIALDGCYLPSPNMKDKNSSFLEQACDRTNGVYLAPSGASQIGGCLTEVLLTVFLPSRSIRNKYLNMPTLDKVDFRARCFETGESVDMAFVCNQCLSIFKNRPVDFCPTCSLPITAAPTQPNNGSNAPRLET